MSFLWGNFHPIIRFEDFFDWAPHSLWYRYEVQKYIVTQVFQFHHIISSQGTCSILVTRSPLAEIVKRLLLYLPTRSIRSWEIVKTVREIRVKVEVNRTRIQSRQMLAGDKLNVDMMRDDVQYQNGPIQTSFYKLETETFRQRRKDLSVQPRDDAKWFSFVKYVDWLLSRKNSLKHKLEIKRKQSKCNYVNSVKVRVANFRKIAHRPSADANLILLDIHL